MPPRKTKAPLPNAPTAPVSAPVSIAPVSAPTPSRSSSVGLPAQLNINVPSFESLLPSDWYTDSSSVPTQTDEAREQAAKSIAEKRNTIATLRDNIALATDIATAATDFTKLLKQGISYQIGIEALQTEGVKLTQQQTRTQMETAKLSNLQQDVQGTQQLGHKQQQVWQAKLEELDNRIKEMRNKSQPYLPATEN